MANEQTDEELIQTLLLKERRRIKKKEMIKRWNDRQKNIMETKEMNEELRREFNGLTGSILVNGGNQKW